MCMMDDMKLLGTHNYENVMAACAMAMHVYGVPVECIRKSVKAFKGVEHRIEYVEKNGVIYYNDSKGTNPDAAIKAIQAMNRPTVVIGGGYDKIPIMMNGSILLTESEKTGASG